LIFLSSPKSELSVLEVATRFAPKFLSSHILPVLGERTVLYLNPLKFIVPLVEGRSLVSLKSQLLATAIVRLVGL
jgi:hypothetical protein